MKKILKNTYIYKMSKKKIIGRNVLYILYSGELKDWIIEEIQLSIIFMIYFILVYSFNEALR